MKLPGRKSRSMIVTVVLAVASIGYVFFVFLPGQKAIGQWRRELTTKQQYIIDSDRLSHAMQQVHSDFQAAERYSAKWREAAPGEPELAALLGRLTTEAAQAEVAIVRLDRRELLRLETIWHVPVVLECRGRFDQVFELVRRLEAMPQELWITELKLTRSSEDAQTVHAELVVTIFADNSEISD
jgi:Tfp pilus assembly protein PilO